MGKQKRNHKRWMNNGASGKTDCSLKRAVLLNGRLTILLQAMGLADATGWCNSHKGVFL